MEVILCLYACPGTTRQRLSRVCVVACGKQQVVVSCPNLVVELAFLSRKTTPALLDVITTSDDDDYDDDVSS